MPELLSMNVLMAGMAPAVMALRMHIPSAGHPATPHFWFVMSMGLLVGFVIAYPMNWWLVANHLKHGMMTVRPPSAADGEHDHGAEAGMRGMPYAGSRAAMGAGKTRPPVPVMTLLSFLALAAGVAIALLLRWM